MNRRPPDVAATLLPFMMAGVAMLLVLPKAACLGVWLAIDLIGLQYGLETLAGLGSTVALTLGMGLIAWVVTWRFASRRRRHGQRLDGADCTE